MKRIIKANNNTYRSAIRCATIEVICDEGCMAGIKNSSDGSYAHRFRK